MNKKRIFSACLTMLCIIALCFAGCGIAIPKNETESNSAELQNEIAKENSSDSLYSAPLASSVSSDKGAYIIEYTKDIPSSGSNVIEVNGDSPQEYSLIKFIDGKTLKKVTLCNKPSCAHNDSSCNAYILHYAGVKFDGGQARFPMLKSYYIFEHNGKLITIDPYGDVVSMNSDGTKHQKLLTVDSKYTIENGYLYGGNVYLHARYLPPYDSDAEQSFSEEDYSLALLKVDLEKKTCEELFSFKNELDTSLLGLYENKAYYSYRSPNTVASANNQQAVDDEMNSHNVKLFSADLSTGERTDIKKDIISFEFDNPIMAENSIYYHCRKTKELKKLSLDSGNEETFLTNFGGYIEHWSGKSVFDNKLFFIKDNALENIFAEPAKMNETYYIDLKTKELKKINCSPTPLRSIIAETSDYYFLPQDHDTAAIKKDDFYSGKQNLIPIE